MMNIIRSINYETRKSKILIRMYIVFVLLMALIALLNINTDADNMTYTSGMLSKNKTIPFLFPLFIVAMFIGYICCSDYKDKVINYELLSGHSRKKVYLSRTLYGILITSVFSTVLSLVPMVTGIIAFGWGDSIVLSEAVIRHLLLFFPYLRLTAFLAFLCVLIKSPYIMTAIGYLLFVLEGFVVHRSNYYISLFNMNKLMDYSSFSGKLVIMTIATSLLMAAVYVIIGYAIFRRSDMD